MSLTLGELKKVVKNVVKNERNIDTLKEELIKTLGPTVLVSKGLEKMANSANERIDVLEALDKSYEKIKPSLLLKFADSPSSEVRKLVVRLLPETFLKSFMRDSDPSVRASVAKRLSYNLVNEMTRRFPADEVLKQIAKTKRLNEAGLPDAKVADEEFDMYGLEPIGAVFGDIDYPDLTDAWYDTTALKIVNTYGRNIEEQWEESTVHQYVDSMASMGVEVDRQKLLDAVYELLSNREEESLQENSLASLVNKLRLDEAEVMPVISETQDRVDELLSLHVSNSDYIKKFEEIFVVEYTRSKNPASVLFEGLSTVNHPSVATLNSSFIRDIDEKATDKYVAAWNSKNVMKGETHYRLSWSPNFLDNTINFHLELK